MDRKELIRQYETIRDTMLKNAEAIATLVSQSEELTKAANTLSTSGNQEAATSLKEQVISLKATISTLVEQTTDLFEQYKKFADKLFD